MVDLQKILEWLDVYPREGVIVWKKSPNPAARVGQIAGGVCKDGRRIIFRGADRKFGSVATHRIIWAVAHGRWPKGEIDHINGDRLDNRIENLRDCTHAENGRNLKMNKNNTSGYKGVVKYRERWIAQIMLDGKKYHIGIFDDPRIASEAYWKTAQKLHGEYARAA